MYLTTALLLLLSLAPIAFLLWYFDSLDKEQKESRRFLWSIFLWGVIITFVAGFVEYFLAPFAASLFTHPLTQAFIIAFIVTAFTEEGLKFAVVKKKAYDHPAFNEYYDGVIYSVVASLGFAALENIFYVMEGGMYIAIIRALLAVPAHALFGAFMGYYISMARFEKTKKKEQQFLLKGLFYAIFFHGLYDFLLLSNSSVALFVIPLILLLYISVRRKIRHLHYLDNIKDVSMPPKWTIGSIIKLCIGMLFFTLGLLTIFVIALYITNDPLGHGLFTTGEFSIPISASFAAFSLLIAFALIREKKV
ncbi:PrsW family intramembrane metalloprotease [Candidatus Peregrinibacteria bacterium]|nr:PrsW family intramembrane metalloprotease [Candidatus Peregrinibacteria bacterium]